MNNPILTAFDSSKSILNGYDSIRHRILVMRDDALVGEIVPERDGYHERAFSYVARSPKQAPNGNTPVGPVFNPAHMRKLLVEAFTNGDDAAFNHLTLRLANSSGELVSQ